MLATTTFADNQFSHPQWLLYTPILDYVKQNNQIWVTNYIPPVLLQARVHDFEKGFLWALLYTTTSHFKTATTATRKLFKIEPPTFQSTWKSVTVRHLFYFQVKPIEHWALEGQKCKLLEVNLSIIYNLVYFVLLNLPGVMF